MDDDLPKIKELVAQGKFVLFSEYPIDGISYERVLIASFDTRKEAEKLMCQEPHVYELPVIWPIKSQAVVTIVEGKEIPF